jgi:hypothetical protein
MPAVARRRFFPEETMNEQQQKRLAVMPTSMRGTYLKAIGQHDVLGEKKPASKAKAIHAQCDECSGYDRATVRSCTSKGCPLWPHRPYQTKP